MKGQNDMTFRQELADALRGKSAAEVPRTFATFATRHGFPVSEADAKVIAPILKIFTDLT